MFSLKLSHTAWPHLPRSLRGAPALLAACLAAAPAAFAQGSAAPQFASTQVMGGLSEPWDIAFAPGGPMFFTEKCAGLSVRMPDGAVRRLMGNAQGYALRANDLFCQGQSGVHGVAVDPAFAQGQRFVYVFSASNLSTNPRSNRVIRLRVNDDFSRVSERTDIVTDIRYKEGGGGAGGPGAHSGGRLRFGPDGFLYVTTGDNHHPDIPQSPTLIGGKVLRIDRDGKAAPGNNTPSDFDARIYAYGMRNPQGLTFRPAGQPGAGQPFIAEHGPNHSDEVSALAPGANGGWDPRNRPGLDCRGNGYCGYAGNAQTMPMTDTQRFADALRPLWTNQSKSEGMGPAEFLSGPQWREWNGALAVGLMRERRLDLLTIGPDSRSARAVVAEVLGSPRLRSLVQGPDGALWAATDSGQILRMTLR
ncbi:PQQ-dependent sugar dehydrogenase [Ramlibacter tataouinensis]|uniref:Glucose/Sorbosone dehydrogenase domain-containing protein n=1 Tax=Ramlibacter tataouinensis (strain ATCC BAA-407 / DSM 14655 / LMG 21543 / TTB310) TaxID=365046 RepID=F5Y373_RAMTT|nr:PQQ-dependent sugar dehydrogenase [Ramlibacter tataouinensis]AEG91160.1 Conserved hypothetical protein [Ramlibacter tataouinensis TTB310]